MRGVKNKHRRQGNMLYCVQGSHSHSLYLIYALLSRNQPCRVYALFGGHFWPKIWWEGAQKHFIQPGVRAQFQKCVYNSTFSILSWFLCQKFGGVIRWAPGPTVRGPIFLDPLYGSRRHGLCALLKSNLSSLVKTNLQITTFNCVNTGIMHKLVKGSSLHHSSAFRFRLASLSNVFKYASFSCICRTDSVPGS